MSLYATINRIRLAGVSRTYRQVDVLPAQLDRCHTPAQIARELDRRLEARPRDLRDVAVDYLALSATLPEGRA